MKDLPRQVAADFEDLEYHLSHVRSLAKRIKEQGYTAFMIEPTLRTIKAAIIKDLG